VFLRTIPNVFNIIVTGVNDLPVWIGLPDTIVISEDNNLTTEWSLSDYIVDSENDVINYLVTSPNPNITVFVENDHRLKITAADNYYGDTFINICAVEVHNHSAKTKNISIPVTVEAVNDPPMVELQLPTNGSVLSDTTVTFEWKVYDIDNSISDLSYQLNLGTSKEPSVYMSDISGNKFTTSGLTEGVTYYWRIIPSDGEEVGPCLNDTWSFSISTNTTVPTVILNSPLNGSITNSTEVNLTWEIINTIEGEMVFHVYMGTNRDNLSEVVKTHDTWLTLTSLDDNTTYYWSVIPVIGILFGRCAETWQFTVDTTFEIIYNISVEIDMDRLDIVHGKNGLFNVTLTNNGNIPTSVEIKYSGKLAGFINATDNIILAIKANYKLPIAIIDTGSIIPDNYMLTIEIIYHDEIKTFTIPVNITTGASIVDDDGATPDKGSSDKNWISLILGVVALLVILAVGIILVLRRKRSKEEEDYELEKVEADIVKPSDSPFSQTQQVTQSQPIPQPQYAPSVKHSSYMQKMERAVPSAFSVPMQAPKGEIKDIKSILADVRPEIAPPPQAPAVPAPPAQVEQLPLRAGEPGTPSVTHAPQPIPTGPQIVGIDTQFSISDMFLIYVDGRLVKSVSLQTKLSEGMDEDIMSGMLTAITDFIKDSFSEESGSLKSLQYGKMTIYLERGVGMYLATVFHGHPPHDLREKMRWLLIHLWERFKLKLKVWDGSMDGLDELDSMLKGLMGQSEPTVGGTVAEAPVVDRGPGQAAISTATEAVMCGICMGVVKPGLEVMTCNCSGKYHKACGERIGTCPRCNMSLIIHVSPSQPTTIAPREEVPLPAGYMPPPPGEILNDNTKFLPEYSGQKAGETGDLKIDL